MSIPQPVIGQRLDFKSINIQEAWAVQWQLSAICYPLWCQLSCPNLFPQHQRWISDTVTKHGAFISSYCSAWFVCGLQAMFVGSSLGLSGQTHLSLFYRKVAAMCGISTLITQLDQIQRWRGLQAQNTCDTMFFPVWLTGADRPCDTWPNIQKLSTASTTR